MGALFSGVCYPTPQEARSAACSASYSLSVTSGGAVVSLECTSSDGISSTMSLTKTVDGVSSTITRPWPPTPECDFDGSNLLADFWPYALALALTVYGIKRLVQAFDSGPSSL